MGAFGYNNNSASKTFTTVADSCHNNVMSIGYNNGSPQSDGSITADTRIGDTDLLDSEEDTMSLLMDYDDAALDGHSSTKDSHMVRC